MLTKALTMKMAAVTTAAALGIGPAAVPASAPVETTTHAESGPSEGLAAGGGGGGNLVVVVPVTPSRSALRGLCSALLAGRDGQSATTSGRRATSADGE